jgi:hypothetical protein
MTALPELRAALTAGIQRQRRRQRAGAAALLVGTVSVVCAVLVLSEPETNHETLAVVRSHSIVDIRIVDATASAEEMTRSLQAGDVPAQVRAVPVANVRVGTWLGAAEQDTGSSEPVPEQASSLPARLSIGELTHRATVIRLPAARLRDTRDLLVLYVGRAARPGERPVALLDRTLPGNNPQTPQPEYTPKIGSR